MGRTYSGRPAEMPIMVKIPAYAKLPLELRQRVVHLHDDGVSFREIGRQVGLHYQQVQAIIEHGGDLMPVPTGKPKRCGECGGLTLYEDCIPCELGRRARQKKIDNEAMRDDSRRAFLRDLYFNAKLTIKQISRQHGVRESVVRKAIRDA